MKQPSPDDAASLPVLLPGRLFAQIAQVAASHGYRSLALEFIDMAFLAFSVERDAPTSEASAPVDLRQLPLCPLSQPAPSDTVLKAGEPHMV